VKTVARAWMNLGRRNAKQSAAHATASNELDAGRLLVFA
jgi:hypothetical protein